MPSIKKTATALLLLLLLRMTSCSSTNSTQIEASAFYGSLGVGPNIVNVMSCFATWQVGGSTGTYIELQNGDKTTCSDGTTEVTMQEDKNLIGQINYTTTSLTFAAGKTYTITLYKNGTKYISQVVLPESVTIGSPTGGSSVPKGTPLSVQWNQGSGNRVAISLSWSVTSPQATNGSSQEQNTTDTGRYTTPGTFTQTINGTQQVTGTATATLKLSRTRNGTFAPSGLQGGAISATQIASAVFSLTD